MILRVVSGTLYKYLLWRYSLHGLIFMSSLLLEFNFGCCVLAVLRWVFRSCVLAFDFLWECCVGFEISLGLGVSWVLSLLGGFLGLLVCLLAWI